MKRDRHLQRTEWEGYLNFISLGLHGRRITLEITGLDIGSQLESGLTLSEGLSYDPRHNIVYVHTDRVNHRISEPEDIYAIENGALIDALCVRDSYGHLQIMRFSDPLMLSPPGFATI